jgi:hypothetical protein
MPIARPDGPWIFPPGAKSTAIAREMSALLLVGFGPRTD